MQIYGKLLHTAIVLKLGSGGTRCYENYDLRASNPFKGNICKSQLYSLLKYQTY